MSRSIRIHYDRPGKGTTVYVEQLVLDRPDVKVTLLPTFEGRDVLAGDAVILQRGAPVVWYVFPDQWRDIGRFHLADGTFTGWYTNLCHPVEMKGSDWYCTDLVLDHWLPVSGEPVWLDEEEFRLAIDSGVLPPDAAARARHEQERIAGRVSAGSWPPAITKEIDLAYALKATAE